MRNPGEEARNKGKRKTPLPPGGGAAGRARQFEIERGIGSQEDAEGEPDESSQAGGGDDDAGEAQGAEGGRAPANRRAPRE